MIYFVIFDAHINYANPTGFPLVGGGGGLGGISPPTSQNFNKSPLTKILSLPINVPLHLVWHPLPSISQSPPL